MCRNRCHPDGLSIVHPAQLHQSRHIRGECYGCIRNRIVTQAIACDSSRMHSHAMCQCVQAHIERVQPATHVYLYMLLYNVTSCLVVYADIVSAQMRFVVGWLHNAAHFSADGRHDKCCEPGNALRLQGGTYPHCALTPSPYKYPNPQIF